MYNHKEYVRNKLKTDPVYKEKHYARIKRNKLIYHNKVDELTAEFRANGCVICGEMEECCLDAHHIEPGDKLFNVGEAKTKGLAFNKIKNELNKCVCLCANCHRKLDAGIVELKEITMFVKNENKFNNEFNIGGFDWEP